MIRLSDTLLLWFILYLQNKYKIIMNICNLYMVQYLVLYYLLPLIAICHKVPDINCHLYADDLQIYIDLPFHVFNSYNYSLLNCLNTLNSWFFLQNNLILNMSKTSLINFSRVNYIFPK